MPTSREIAAARVIKRDAFMEALKDFVDARIRYEQADPEWRTDTRREEGELELALDRLLGDVT